MIDILMAVYNGEKYLSQQIDSILNQSFHDWQLLIRDDGSSDSTAGIIALYADRHPEKIRLVYSKSDKKGSKYNFFELIKASDSEYVMLADQDDVWEKDKVKKAYEHIRKAEKKTGQNKPVLCHSDLKVADRDLNIINPSMFEMQKLDPAKRQFKDYLVQNNVTGCTVIFNRALASMTKKMPEEAIMHDWWLALEAAAFGRVFFMKDSDILYRQHGNNTEGAKNLRSTKYLIKKLFNKTQVRQTLENTYRQAEAFFNEYEDSLDNEFKEVVKAYLSIREAPKLKKYMIMKKYGFMKSGFVRRLGYILFV